MFTRYKILITDRNGKSQNGSLHSTSIRNALHDACQLEVNYSSIRIIPTFEQVQSDLRTWGMTIRKDMAADYIVRWKHGEEIIITNGLDDAYNTAWSVHNGL